jgi:hypothetical protein
MPRIATCNARRRARDLRARDDVALRAWKGYVEAIEGRRVWLEMVEVGSDRKDCYQASFPMRLFGMTEPAPGMLFDVAVTRDRRIRIRPVPTNPDARNAGAELAELLRQVRLEQDDA